MKENFRNTNVVNKKKLLLKDWTLILMKLNLIIKIFFEN